MKRAIREYGIYVALIIGFAALAVVAGGYIVIQQRFPVPFRNNYTIKVAFANTIGVVPGLGEPVTVAGVQVGQITGAKLLNGQAVASLTINKGQLKQVYSNATATLYPNTPLEDMQINIDPGDASHPILQPGQTLPVTQSTEPYQPDDFFNALDGDSRDYLTELIDDFGQGVGNKGNELRALFESLSPTTQEVDQLSTAFAQRHTALSHVIHNFSILATAANKEDQSFSDLVTSGDTTLAALSSQDQALEKSFQLFPSTLAAAKSSLVSGDAFSKQLHSTLDALNPATSELSTALKQVAPLITASQPFLKNQLTPLVDNGTPVLKQLAPALSNVTVATPDFTNVTQVFQYFANELLYNKGDSSKSYAFWLAWFAHNLNSTVSTGDAYGSGLRTILQVPCTIFDAAQGSSEYPLDQLLRLVVNTSLCPGS